MFAVLGKLNDKYEIDLLMHGAAKGADVMAGDWACSYGIPVRRFPADWSKGVSGGPIRNQLMLAEGKPDLVVAFPNGPLRLSKGTLDMVTKAVNARVDVLVVDIDGSLYTHDGFPVPQEVA